jgi:hypothetical protein
VPPCARNGCRSKNETSLARKSRDHRCKRYGHDLLQPVSLPILPRRPRLAGVLQDSIIAGAQCRQSHVAFGRPVSTAAILLPFVRYASGYGLRGREATRRRKSLVVKLNSLNNSRASQQQSRRFGRSSILDLLSSIFDLLVTGVFVRRYSCGVLLCHSVALS